MTRNGGSPPVPDDYVPTRGDHSMPRDLLRSQRLRMVNQQGDAPAACSIEE